MPIKYVKGDATKPQGAGSHAILHIVNDIGRWAKGFVLAVSKRWSQPEIAYKKWYKGRILSIGSFELGNIQTVKTYDCVVVNMIAQHGLRTGKSGPPIRYDALKLCLQKVAATLSPHLPEMTIHMPRIGCGLSGATWDKVEPIILETLEGFDVTVYDLEENDGKENNNRS